MRPPAPTDASTCSRSCTSCPRPRIGSSASSSGSSTKIRSISSSIVAVRIEIASPLGSSARTRGRCLGAERAVHLPGDDAERVHLGEERLGVARQRVEREVPAVGRARQVLLQHAERGVHQPPVVLEPAGDRRDVREVALAQEAQQLELGVDARLDAPERLQDQRLAEHDRRVRLLDADRAHLDGAALARRRPPSGTRACRRPPARRRRAHQVQQLARVRGIGERVVVGVAAGLGDDAVAPALGGGPDADRHLVDLVRPLREARLDQRQHELRRVLAQRERLEDVEAARPRWPSSRTSAAARTSRAAAPRERARATVTHPPRPGSTSWNQ
jgi:hypothetical protein